MYLSDGKQRILLLTLFLPALGKTESFGTNKTTRSNVFTVAYCLLPETWQLSNSNLHISFENIHRNVSNSKFRGASELPVGLPSLQVTYLYTLIFRFLTRKITKSEGRTSRELSNSLHAVSWSARRIFKSHQGCDERQEPLSRADPESKQSSSYRQDL